MPVSDSAREVRLGIKKVHFMVKKLAAPWFVGALLAAPCFSVRVYPFPLKSFVHLE